MMSTPDAPDSPNRFQEEKQTYTVRGSELPDLDAGIAAIRNVWQTLPIKPGVYRMHDARGDILSVGKAKALKNRVTNYTQVDRLPRRALLRDDSSLHPKFAQKRLFAGSH